MGKSIERDEQKHIYIVFSSTNTIVGKAIRLLTRNRYNHVSLAFEEDLKVMYSFARYHINSPLFGGFVQEKPARYLNNNGDIEIKVCKLPVSDAGYDSIQNTVQLFLSKKGEMVYNTFSAMFSLLRKRVLVRDAYTCIEFVASIIMNVSDIMDISENISIKELEKILLPYQVYAGSFRSVVHPHGYEECVCAGEDEYLERQGVWAILFCSLRHFKILFSRCIKL